MSTKNFFLLPILLFLANMLFAQTLQKVSSIEAKPILSSLDLKTSVIIDGRDSAKFLSGHIKNAICIDAFDDNAKNLLSKHLDKENIVVYCTMNGRSEKIIEILQSIWYQGVIINITDGISGWKENDFPVEK